MRAKTETKAPPKLPWRPMNEMPAELRDGRQVLLRHWGGVANYIGCYRYGVWELGPFLSPLTDSHFTHFCEITPPSE